MWWRATGKAQNGEDSRDFSQDLAHIKSFLGLCLVKHLAGSRADVPLPLLSSPGGHMCFGCVVDGPSTISKAHTLCSELI